MATERLEDLIASGRLDELMLLPGRDRYDRGLGRLYIGGANVGEILTAEKLARPYDGGRRAGWC